MPTTVFPRVPPLFSETIVSGSVANIAPPVVPVGVLHALRGHRALATADSADYTSRGSNAVCRNLLSSIRYVVATLLPTQGPRFGTNDPSAGGTTLAL